MHSLIDGSVMQYGKDPVHWKLAWNKKNYKQTCKAKASNESVEEGWN